MKERVILRERSHSKALQEQFNISGYLVSKSLLFDRNSVTARKIRAWAVNHMKGDVFLLQKHLI